MLLVLPPQAVLCMISDLLLSDGEQYRREAKGVFAMARLDTEQLLYAIQFPSNKYAMEALHVGI